jgi:hypothetical protein
MSAPAYATCVAIARPAIALFFNMLQKIFLSN